MRLGAQIKMNEIIKNYEQPIKFITGFAGSGKSTRLVAECDVNTLVLTPTHKAAGVLIGKGLHNVFTIHSVLKLVPTIDDNFRGRAPIQKLKKVGKVDLSTITRIAIDEFSMIPTFIFEILTAALPDDAEIVVFGDPYQLSPINGDPIDPYFCTDDVEELTTQHRANAPEVVDTFMRFMRYIKAGARGKADLTMHKGIARFDNPIEAFKANNYNPDTDTIIAYTNNQVINLNNMAANYLGIKPVFSEGDALIANGLSCVFAGNAAGQKLFPNCVAKGSLLGEDARQEKVVKTLMDMEKYGTDISMYKKATINIEDEDFEISYDAKHYATSKKLKGEVTKYQNLVVETHGLDKGVHLPRWCSENRDAQYVKERGKAWSDYLAHQNLVFDLRRPYATTVHKAQGQEFDTVYISHKDMQLSIKDNYYETYSRLMYVALSRAINRVVII